MLKQDLAQFQVPELEKTLHAADGKWRQNMVKTIGDVNSHG